MENRVFPSEIVESLVKDLSLGSNYHLLIVNWLLDNNIRLYKYKEETLSESHDL